MINISYKLKNTSLISSKEEQIIKSVIYLNVKHIFSTSKHFTTAVLLLIILFFQAKVNAQTITTGAITPTAYCAGATVDVAFTYSGAVSGDFTVELSDSSGSFSTPDTIGSGSTSPISATIPSNTAQGTRYRIRVVDIDTETIGSDNGSNITINTTSTSPNIWNGSAWSLGSLDISKPVRFEGNYTIGSTGGSIDLTACSLTVANSAVVIVSPERDVTLYGPLTVSSGSFTLENTASLIQKTEVSNSGTIIVKRNSSNLMRFDYTLWSSPVASQNLFNFSPQTVTTRFYTYNQTNNLYSLNDMYGSGALSSSSTFQNGRGYLIRMPFNHPTAPTAWTGQFTGVPNNGTISLPLTYSGTAFGYNLVGNPYPSPISVTTFLNQNSALIESTLWFWRKTNGVAGTTYETLTAGTNSGGNGTGPGGSDESTDDYIQQGQGFFVKAKANGNLQYTNLQRIGIVDTFYRTNNATNTSPAIGRVWLHLKSNDVVVGSLAIGYREGATNELDEDYDGKYFNDSPLALTSFVQGEELSVQHRAVPFADTDIVPLSFKTDVAGTYTIAINAFDGLFSNGQSIYLRDNLTGTVQNLNTAPYSFTSAVGVFTSRFEIVYQSALNVSAPSFNATQVVIYQNAEKDIVVTTSNIVMADIKVFDIRGRLIEEKMNINATQTTINSGMAHQVLLVQITSEDGVVVTKKVVR
jgi:hypothetical protein